MTSLSLATVIISATSTVLFDSSFLSDFHRLGERGGGGGGRKILKRKQKVTEERETEIINSMIFIPALPFLDSALDIITVTFISALIILSVLSLCFIFHLYFKSKFFPHLQDFNSLWTVRFLLVFFIFLWAITELLRLPFFRHKYLYPFLPSFGLDEQANLCKVHIVLSLGFFEPAFLVTLLFLVNASIRKKTPNDIWAISFVLITCLPLTIFQIILLFAKPLEFVLPSFLRRTSIILTNGNGTQTVLCTYPLLNSVVFAVFGIVYSVWFLFSCWKVLSLVINKGLRTRIYGLAFGVLISLPLQILFLGLTELCNPDEEAYGVVALGIFMGAFCCAAVGQGVLVIKPVSDALDAGGDRCRWSSGGSRTQMSKETAMVAEERGERNV